MNRRKFIDIFLGVSLTGTVVSFLYPVIRYILPSKRIEAIVNKVTAARVGELAPNSYKIFKFGTTPGILINTIDGELRAFSAACNVLYESDTETILCPCHNGRFDLNGKVISGPPPSPLEAFKVEIAGEEIMVSRE
ncbi:MAG: Rieske 2Fe-2S domain-containing protein [Candidatus Aminicenantes bacterium]|jgi:cytochrome b6-f complex iron-sulfur subunit